jgi:hypothetical protein
MIDNDIRIHMCISRNPADNYLISYQWRNKTPPNSSPPSPSPLSLSLSSGASLVILLVECANRCYAVCACGTESGRGPPAVLPGADVWRPFRGPGALCPCVAWSTKTLRRISASNFCGDSVPQKRGGRRDATRRSTHHRHQITKFSVKPKPLIPLNPLVVQQVL